jgi:hypothetical protein
MDHSIVFLIILILVLILVFQPNYFCVAILVCMLGLLWYKYLYPGREGFVNRDIPIPKDPVVNRQYDYVVDRKEPDVVHVVDELPEIPPELDNSSSISDLVDNYKDLNDTIVDEMLYMQKNYKRGLDRNNRNNVDAYSVWWKEELEDTAERFWFDDPETSDAAQFFRDSIDKQERVDSWVATGYTHLE